MATELGLLATARQARFYQARLHWVHAEHDLAERQLRQLQTESEAADGVTWMASTRLLAENFMVQGRYADAEPLLDAAIERSQSTGERWSRSELISFKAETRARLGDLTTAEALLAETEKVLRPTDYAAAAVYYYSLAFVRTLQGRDDEAEEALRRQIEEIQKSDNFVWQLAVLDLAEFLVARGRSAEAEPLVARVAQALATSDIRLHRKQFERVQAALKTAGVETPPPAAAKASPAR